MTEPIYQTDSYLKQFKASISAVTEEGVVLDRSAFYPGGGGQPPDWGSLETNDGKRFKVVGTKRIDGRQLLVLEGEAKPPSGAVVTGILDWPRRYLRRSRRGLFHSRHAHGMGHTGTQGI